MQSWLPEFIKKITLGHWKKDENIFVAQIGNVRIVYIPLGSSKAEVVIRCLDPLTRRYPSISPFYQVDPKDWTWVRRDATNNLVPRKPRPTLYVVVGPPASGKTTWRKEQVGHLPVVSPDKYGDVGQGGRWWAAGDDFHRANIGKAWAWTWQRFSERLQTGQDFVFEATLPTKISRSPIINVAKGFGYEVICVYHVECLQTLLQRNTMRSPSVPSEAVARGFLADEEPEFSEGWDKIIVANATEHGDMHTTREET